MCFLGKKLILLIFLFSSTSLIAQVNLQSGLVACYPFSGNANDATGNGNNGVVKGPVLTTDRFGRANNAYSFDGINDYITVNAGAFKNNQYSYSVWARNIADPTDGVSAVVISIGDISTGVHQTVNVNNDYINSITGWSVGGYNNGTPRTSTVQKGVIQAKNVWYHVVAIRNSNNITMYLNGQLVGNTPTNGTTPDYGSSSAFVIGMRCDLTQPFRGDIDDILIYNRALTADEVLEIYKTGAPCSPEVLLDPPKVNDMNQCGNGSVKLTASGTADTYRWYDAETNGNLLFEGNPFVTPVLSATKMYYVSAKTGNKESKRTKVTVTVFPQPVITCHFPEKVNLDESHTYKVEVTHGTPPYQFVWNLGDSASFASSQTSVSKTFSRDGIYEMSVKVTDKNGCENTCVQKVEVMFDPYIPNIITPNEDSLNTIFSVYDFVSKKRYTGNLPFEMSIYNRWGMVVYKTTDSVKGWDGEASTDGVYYYQIALGSRRYKGWVHLVR